MMYPYKYCYYIHFRDGEDLTRVSEAFHAVCDCIVEPVFYGSFALLTDLSFSKIHHVLVTAWSEDAVFLALVKKNSWRLPPDPLHPESV